MVATIAFGSVLQALNASTMAVALVDIRGDFHAGAATSWLVSGLYLATAIGSPTAGRLADLLGARRIFFGSLAVVVLASVAAPFAPSLGWLIVWRVALGLGTCAAFPSGVSMLRAEADRLGIATPAGALSALAISGQVMIAIGPVVAGALVQRWGWPSIFWMNLPLVAAVVAMAWVWLPREQRARPETTRRVPAVLASLDLPGMALFTATMATLMLLLLSLGGSPRWWLLPVVVVLAAAFVTCELRVDHPFVDLRLLAGNRALTSTYLRTALTYVAFYVVFYGLPMWLESGRGLPTGEVGLVVLPIAVCAMAAVAAATRAVRRGHWPVLLAGSALFLAGGTALTWLSSTTAVPTLLVVAGVLGLPNGLNNIGNQTALYRAAEADRAGVASGLYRTSQYVGANIAAAVIELCFAGTPSDPGLHRLGVVVAAISVVLLAGAVAGTWRAVRGRPA